MPILPPEPFLFPPDLFSTSPEAEWSVLHTRSRAEKALARWLLAASVRFFLPLYKKPWSSRGRTQTTYAPLFPGYLFLRGDADARHHALASNLVAHCLPVHDQDGLDADLSGVHRLMAGEVALTPVQALPAGSPVEVVEGPFAGMTGKLVRGDTTRLLVEVRMINQGVAVEIDRAAVRPYTENGSAERARLALLRR